MLERLRPEAAEKMIKDFMKNAVPGPPSNVDNDDGINEPYLVPISTSDRAITMKYHLTPLKEVKIDVFHTKVFHNNVPAIIQKQWNVLLNTSDVFYNNSVQSICPGYCIMVCKDIWPLNISRFFVDMGLRSLMSEWTDKFNTTYIKKYEVAFMTHSNYIMRQLWKTREYLLTRAAKPYRKDYRK